MKSKFVSVIKVKEGVVNSAKIFSNAKDAEECFITEATILGAKKEDMESYLDNGYYSIMNASVCLVHPDDLRNEKLYILVHNHRFGSNVEAVELCEEPSLNEAEKFFDYDPNDEEEIKIIEKEVVFNEEDFNKILKESNN